MRKGKEVEQLLLQLDYLSFQEWDFILQQSLHFILEDKNALAKEGNVKNMD